MMGRQAVDQGQLFYLFNLERRIPERHLLRRINPTVTGILAEIREKLEPFYSEIGRPSIDPELMIRMLIVGYCYGIRFERKLCEEVELHLAYRWFYDVFDGDRDVGRIYLVDESKGYETWFWGVSFQLTVRKSYGTATSLEEAKAAFRAEYLKWQANR
jgi:hypothetical protein